MLFATRLLTGTDMTILGIILTVIGVLIWVIYETLERQQRKIDKLEEYVEDHEEWHCEPHAKVTVKAGKLAKSTEDAACFDVYASTDIQIKSGEMALVPTGIITEMFGCDAFLFDRSGLALKFWLTRRAGVIDEKYPEEWGVVVANEGRMEFNVKKGDRICQALFLPKFAVEVEADPEGTGEVLVSGEKRISGFGSTGT